MKITFFFLTLTAFISTANAGECSHEEGSFKCVDFVRNLDGDTFVVDIPRVHAFFGSEIGIRIRGIDTGEIRNYEGKTKCEYQMAIMAKTELERLFAKATEIELRDTERGKYFRVLADVYINKRSVSQHMLKKGLAVEYDGGSRGDTDWCKVKKKAEKLLTSSN